MSNTLGSFPIHHIYPTCSGPSKHIYYVLHTKCGYSNGCLSLQGHPHTLHILTQYGSSSACILTLAPGSAAIPPTAPVVTLPQAAAVPVSPPTPSSTAQMVCDCVPILFICLLCPSQAQRPVASAQITTSQPVFPSYVDLPPHVRFKFYYLSRHFSYIS
jgi:hypothetical protein